LIFFCICCSNSDNDRFGLFVFIEILRFVILFFIVFKAFDTTQIFRVTNLVNSFARRRQVFENIEFLVSNEFVDLV